MFDILQACCNLNSGTFVNKTGLSKNQISRSERQRALKKKRTKEFKKSLDAIKCPFARERITRKWWGSNWI